MKGLTITGVVLVLLGVLSFIIPVPQREEHSVKLGDAKIGIQTQSSQKLPPTVGAVLVLAGVGALALGSRRSS